MSWAPLRFAFRASFATRRKPASAIENRDSPRANATRARTERCVRREAAPVSRMLASPWGGGSPVNSGSGLRRTVLFSGMRDSNCRPSGGCRTSRCTPAVLAPGTMGVAKGQRSQRRRFAHRRDCDQCAGPLSWSTPSSRCFDWSGTFPHSLLQHLSYQFRCRHLLPPRDAVMRVNGAVDLAKFAQRAHTQLPQAVLDVRFVRAPASTNLHREPVARGRPGHHKVRVPEGRHRSRISSTQAVLRTSSFSQSGARPCSRAAASGFQTREMRLADYKR